MLSLIEQYKHLETDYSIYTKEINEICNVIKCRICDPDPEIVKRFIHLSRVLTRLGAINKVRGRVLLPSIIQKLNDQTVYLDVLSYMN
jgi:hypothetical protein